MPTKEGTVFQYFRPRMIIFPVVIGMAVLAWAFIQKFEAEAFLKIEWTAMSILWMMLVVMMIAVRQFFYTWRIRLLTNQQLSWRASLESILLWEFSSAATPSAVGGTAAALFILTKEGVRPGKTAAIVLCTIFLDMTFLMGLLTGVLIWFDFKMLIPISDLETFNTTLFISTFTLLLGYAILAAYGLFVNPTRLKKLLVKASGYGFLKRWQGSAELIGQQLVEASIELQQKSISFWIKAFGMTIMTWSGRFLVGNCIVMVLVPEFAEHVLLYARQLVLMIMLMMSPTPGGSGVAELSFPSFLGDLIDQGLIPPITAIWRTLTYYPYLFIGLAILPKWVSRVYDQKPTEIGS